MEHGKMGRRYMQARGEIAMDALAQALGGEAPEKLNLDSQKDASEFNLVRSGLEDTMCEAYQEILQIWRSRDDVPDLRIAAYILAIGRVANDYTQ